MIDDSHVGNLEDYALHVAVSQTSNNTDNWARNTAPQL